MVERIKGNSGIVRPLAPTGSRRRHVACRKVRSAPARTARYFLSYDGGGEASLRDVDHHTLAQLDVLEVGPVGAQRLLVIGAAVDVLEKGLWNFAAGKRAQVFNAGDGLHGDFSGRGSKLSGSTVAAHREMACPARLQR